MDLSPHKSIRGQNGTSLENCPGASLPLVRVFSMKDKTLQGTSSHFAALACFPKQKHTGLRVSDHFRFQYKFPASNSTDQPKLFLACFDR